MIEEQAFLRAVLADPDDDAPRLIYADWLDENGDSLRAEFIRIQCARDALFPWDPVSMHLWKREAELSSQLGQFRNIPRLPHGLRWGSHRRGFPWAVEIYDLPLFLELAEWIFSRAPIQALYIDSYDIAGIGPLLDCPWLQQITLLMFHYLRPDHNPLNIMLDSPHLTRLTHLAFNGWGVTSDSIQTLLHSSLAQRLRGLTLRKNFDAECGDALQEAFSSAPTLGCLESLGFERNHIESEHLEGILNALDAPQLNALSLRETRLWSESACVIAGAQSLASLRALFLNETVRVDGSLRTIIQSPHLRNLRILDVSSNRLGHFTADHIADCPNLAGLVSLSLNDSELGDKGTIALAQAPHLKNLLVLNLACVGVGDRGVRALLDSPHLENLAYLNLDGNDFSESLDRELTQRLGKVRNFCPLDD